MTKRIGISMTLALLLAVTAARAQERPWRASGPQNPPAAQPQPAQPQPTTQPQASPEQPSDQPSRPAWMVRPPYTFAPQQQPADQTAEPQPPTRAPFTLTAKQQEYVDQVLFAWQRRSEGITTLETKFTQRQYVAPEFMPPSLPKDAPKYVDEGMLKYKKPDKGLFRIDGQRPEQWVCDGGSIYEFNYPNRQLVEYRLPPDKQGQAIEDGPLPFLFGASAEKLNRRYWIRAVAPPPGVKDQVWLEAYPRYQQDAADFQYADIILDAKNVLPLGIQLHLPNGKSRTSYSFRDMVVNDPNPLRILEGDPFSPRAPLGWTRVVQNPPAAQASTEAVGGRR